MVIIFVLLTLVGLIWGYIWYSNKMALERQAEVQNQQMGTANGQSMRMVALKSAEMGNAAPTTPYALSPTGTTTTPQHLSQKTKSKKILSPL